ncbi:hypothetical protein DAPPUDRAFT_341183 [Daphnia pulex]|uniref:Uncharacterized protein n=1 Tax=Daphnia pulex TaxID=6669 RepID=E9I586_DAPPU|nr:hypothetical protein DAPPUDRAFT_341183 [Daphnia pulex]|eukprot:EFX60845.1 hypothetical protein DAPPUDRAFT_341183 [Daphnia pulex]
MEISAGHLVPAENFCQSSCTSRKLLPANSYQPEDYASHLVPAGTVLYRQMPPRTTISYWYEMHGDDTAGCAADEVEWIRPYETGRPAIIADVSVWTLAAEKAHTKMSLNKIVFSSRSSARFYEGLLQHTQRFQLKPKRSSRLLAAVFLLSVVPRDLFLSRFARRNAADYNEPYMQTQAQLKDDRYAI